MPLGQLPEASACKDVLFIVWSAPENIFKPGEGNTLVGDTVITVELKDTPVNDLIQSNRLQFSVVPDTYVQGPVCASYDESTGQFITEGVELASGVVGSASSSAIVCSASHMTSFGIVAVAASPLPLHIYVGVGVLTACAALLVLGLFSMGIVGKGAAAPATTSDLLVLNVLVATFFAGLMYCVDAAVTAANTGSDGSVFAVALLLHYALLAYAAAVAALTLHLVRLVALAESHPGGVNFRRLVVFVTWFVTALIVALYVIFALEGGNGVSGTYGDAMGNQRLAFIMATPGGTEGAFTAWMALFGAVIFFGQGALLWHFATSKSQEYTVDEPSLLYAIAARQAGLLVTFAALTVAIGIAATATVVPGLEYLFTVTCFAQVLYILYYAYRRREVQRQLRAGTWDPWAKVQAQKHSTSAARQTSVLSAGSPKHEELPMTHLPAEPVNLAGQRGDYSLMSSPSTTLGGGNGSGYLHIDASNASASSLGMSVAGADAPYGGGVSTFLPPVGPAYDSMGRSQLALHQSEVKVRSPGGGGGGRAGASAGAVGGDGFSTFMGEETLPDFDEGAHGHPDDSGFDDLLYALRTGDVFSNGGGPGEAPRSPGLVADGPTFDLRRVSIADTHL